MVMEKYNRNLKRNKAAHLVLGIVFVLIGLAIIAEIVDAVPWRFRNVIFSWQMILIVLGVIFIAGRESKSTGYILLAIGAFFLMPRFFDVPHYWRSLFWPAILILLGLIIIFGRRRGMSRHKGSSFSTEDKLDDVAIFGGSDRVLKSQNFTGGEITNIFGGSKYDMREVILAEGTNYLEITMIFGGSKFIVPEGWDIRIEVTSIFGGFSDKRMRSIVVPENDRRLVIRGVALFGGGEIASI